MPLLPRLISKIPMREETRLSLHRNWLTKAYARDIAAARKQNDTEKLEKLVRDYRFELQLQDEDEDAYLTKSLLSKARRLRVPVPHRYNEDKTQSEHWYEGYYTGSWFLTTSGIVALREEIRREIKARHEARSHWVVWLSSLTGVIGSITGLVALLIHKP